MKLVRSTITDTLVQIRLADNADDAKAVSWIDCQMERSILRRASGTSVENLDTLPLPTARQVILENVRDLIDAEIARLKTL